MGVIHQTSFPQVECADKKKITRREKFLTRMETVIPWAKRPAVIGPFHLKGERGRPPIGLERMLQVYFPQQWPGPGRRSPRRRALRQSGDAGGFARMAPAAEGVPDATTLLKFRRLPETRDLCKGPFARHQRRPDRARPAAARRHLGGCHADRRTAPTKNKEKKRDPEMHPTRKGNQWHLGMKAHIGADRDSKPVHTAVVTAASVSDITKTAELLHGQEKQVHADAGHTGVEKRAEIVARDRPIDWPIAGKRGRIKKMAEGVEKETLKAVGKAKASVRAFVEHPFHILKNIFRQRKARYRELASVVTGGRGATA